MPALSRMKSTPDNPIRGIVNDVAGVLGWANPEEFFGTPADIMKDLGLPIPQEAIPSPADAGHSLVQGARGGRFPQPPSLPRPESFMPPAPDRGPGGMFGQLPPPFFAQRRSGNYNQGSYYQQERDSSSAKHP